MKPGNFDAWLKLNTPVNRPYNVCDLRTGWDGAMKTILENEMNEPTEQGSTNRKEKPMHLRHFDRWLADYQKQMAEQSQIFLTGDLANRDMRKAFEAGIKYELTASKPAHNAGQTNDNMKLMPVILLTVATAEGEKVWVCYDGLDQTVKMQEALMCAEQHNAVVSMLPLYRRKNTR